MQYVSVFSSTTELSKSKTSSARFRAAAWCAAMRFCPSRYVSSAAIGPRTSSPSAASAASSSAIVVGKLLSLAVSAALIAARGRASASAPTSAALTDWRSPGASCAAFAPSAASASADAQPVRATESTA